MTTIEFFSPPDGEIIRNPKPESLKELVLNRGEDYWNAGAGQGSLDRKQRGRSLQLLLTFSTDHGFYLEYIDRNDVYFVSMGEGTFDQTVTVEVGGDPILLPTAFFISPDQAWAAVEEFCATGKRTTAIRWKDRSEVNWDYGIPDE